MGIKSIALSALFLILSTSVNASLINHGTFTTDPTTSLDWLRWDTTTNLSYNTVISEMGGGGLFEGWRYATSTEAEQFFSNFGLTYSADDWQITTTSQWNDLASYMGFNSDWAPPQKFIYGLVDSSTVSNTTAYVHHFDGIDLYQHRLAEGWYVKDDPIPFIGSFLVRETSTVPVPAAVWLFGSGIMGLIGLARRKAHV